MVKHSKKTVHNLSEGSIKGYGMAHLDKGVTRLMGHIHAANVFEILWDKDKAEKIAHEFSYSIVEVEITATGRIWKEIPAKKTEFEELAIEIKK